MKRLLDLLLAGAGLMALSPFLLLVAVLIVRPAGLLGKLQVKRV